MTETGKIKKKDLFRLWSQDEFNQHMPHKDEKEFVANVLTHLDLLVKPKRSDTQESTSDFFLVPCMVKRETTAHFGENIDNAKSICLSYKLRKSSIPSALSFKLVGAAMNVWPLKATDKGVCLYHKVAILCIDKSNELHLLVREDRVIVYLVNEQSKYLISPDVASCAQECLTLTLAAAFEFYHNSFGKLISKSKVADLFEIEVGEKCDNETCYIPLLEAEKNMSSWVCKFGNKHDTKCLLYWSNSKKHTECQSGCTGLDEQSFKKCPKDKDLARLAVFIGIDKFPEFVIHLGLSLDDWKSLEYKHQRADVNMMKIDALCEWKKKMEYPSFEGLKLAITNIGCNLHILCQLFSEDRSVLHIDNPLLKEAPDNDTLYDLSRNIGNCAIHLGIELDIAITDIEETVARYNKEMFDQNYDILMKWKKKHSTNTGTIRTLMHAMKIVDNRGFNFLKEKYKIDT